MQTITCDVCRKKVDNPTTGRSFFYVGEYDICEPCKDDLEYSIKPQVRTRDPFLVDWYEKLIQNTLEKAVQKGKI